jgi:hypothetical protein
MDGRARYLLTPDFAYSETNPNLTPVVGRTVRWPLPRPPNYVYPSDNTETPPVPAAFTHLCYSIQRQSDGGNPIRTTADTIKNRSNHHPGTFGTIDCPSCLSDGKPKPSTSLGVRLPGPCTGAADIASTNISRR